MIVPTPDMATTPEIAIVGGGIVGLVLAAGLTRRGVQVKLYEQARNFREIGAGIGFTKNTVGCMEKINPAVVTALRSGGAVNVSLDQQDPKSYLRWIDGYGQQREGDPMYQKPLLKLDAGVKGWETVRRDQFLEDLVKVIPEGVVHLRKRLDTIEDNEDVDKVYLNFTDGTRAEADAGKFWLCTLSTPVLAQPIPASSNRMRRNQVQSTTAPTRSGQSCLLPPIHTQGRLSRVNPHGQSRRSDRRIQDLPPAHARRSERTSYPLPRQH